MMYDMIPEGIAKPNDTARDVDRLHFDAPIRNCGTGVKNLRTVDHPRYTQL